MATAPREDVLQLVGTTIDEKYRVEALVGEGGFALVYKATHILFQRPVALKVFRALGDAPEATRDALMKGFYEEGRLLAELSERSAVFVQSRDVGQLMSKGGAWMPYLVLEWLEGQTLEDFLIQQRAEGRPGLRLEEAVRLLEPVGEGLALAHARGIAHRDVKPANIYLLDSEEVTRTGLEDGDEPVVVKLLDLGIAKVVQDAQAGSFSKTAGSVTSFTPMYGAPEQFSRSNGPTGPWTDVFALALVMLEVVSGVPPLQGSTLTEVGWKACNPIDRPGPRSLGIPVSDALEAVFLKALAVQTTNRYESVGFFWRDLREALGMGPMASGPASSGELVSSRQSARLGIAPTAVAPPQSPLVAMSSAGMLAAAGVTGSNPGVPIAAAPSGRRMSVRNMVLGAIGGAFVVGTMSALMALKTSPSPSALVADAGTPAPDAAVVVALPVLTCPSGMIAIPGGKFFMGSDDVAEDVRASERPAHQVKLAPYCMDRLEVTTHDYLACSKNGECKRAGSENDFDNMTDHDKKVFDPLCTMRAPESFDRNPVNCVNWEMASHFCTAQGKRLPTEAEWEFAARGPDGRRYPWGDELPDASRLNACGAECVSWGKMNGVKTMAMYSSNDGYPNSAPVGSFPLGASRYGVEDVVGNVWEWVSDWYEKYDPDGASVTLDNPKGPANGTRKVIRGGAWNGAYPAWVRPSFRYHAGPNQTSYGVGFRCAK